MLFLTQKKLQHFTLVKRGCHDAGTETDKTTVLVLENPQAVHEMPVHFVRTGVWCAIGARVTNFFNETVNGLNVL